MNNVKLDFNFNCDNSLLFNNNLTTWKEYEKDCLPNNLKWEGHSTIKYSTWVNITLDDVIAYEFENKYHTKYNVSSCMLEKGAREFIKEIEDKWSHNNLNTDSWVYDENFLHILKEQHLEEVENQMIGLSINDKLDLVK